MHTCYCRYDNLTLARLLHQAQLLALLLVAPHDHRVLLAGVTA